MSRSVLLQLAHDSIREVFQAQKSIDKEALLNEHPLLREKIPTSVKLYINEELRGSFEDKSYTRSLLDEIIINAKKAAFEDKAFTPISVSEYLSCVIELTLHTQDGVLSEADRPIL